MSDDPQMNTVFLPMGSSVKSMFGGNRQPVDPEGQFFCFGFRMQPQVREVGLSNCSQ